MPKKGAVPSIVLVALILISLSLAAGAFYLFNKEKLISISLEEELEDLRAKERIIETKLEDSKKEAYQLEAELREKKNQIDVLSLKLEEEKKSKQQTLSQLRQLKEEIEKHIKDNAAAEEKLTESQQLVKKMQAQLKNLETAKIELENKLKDVKLAESQKVELGTIVVGQEDYPATSVPVAVTPADTRMKKYAATASVSLEGKVLVINKDYNFAVINLGSRDGLNVDDIYSLYRKDRYLGDIKIEKVHESMSAAHFISAEVRNKLREGDIVNIKSK